MASIVENSLLAEREFGGRKAEIGSQPEYTGIFSSLVRNLRCFMCSGHGHPKKENLELALRNDTKKVAFSIDAATPATYKYVRGGSYQLIWQNIAKLLQARKSSGFEKNNCGGTLVNIRSKK